MNLAKRLDAIETAMAKQYGDESFSVVIVNDDETKEEAAAREGLSGKSATIVFVIFDG